MTSPANTFITGADQLITRARRLGLTWGLRPATVAAPLATDPTMVTVTLDGDTTQVVVYSLVGLPAVGARVMVMFVPPAGSYIIGYAGQQPATSPVSNVETLRFPPSGTITFSTTSYADMTGATQTFTKRLTNSRLHVDLKAQGRATTVGAAYFGYVGININGTDYDVSQYFFDLVNVDRAWSGDRMIDDVPAGTYTITLRGKLGTAAKAFTVGTSNLLTATFTEVF